MSEAPGDAGVTPDIADWDGVRVAVRGRLRELKMPIAELARQTGLSQTTVRYLGMPATPHGATLIAISAVLRWRHDHLGNILRGEPEKNVHVNPPVAVALERAIRAQAEPLRQEIRALKEVVVALDQKLTALLAPGPAGRRRPEAPVTSLPAPDDMDADYSPQYVRLARRVRADIESGKLRPGDPVRAVGLTAQHGVSQPVACAALSMLAANGYLNKPERFHAYEVADLSALVPGSARPGLARGGRAAPGGGQRGKNALERPGSRLAFGRCRAPGPAWPPLGALRLAGFNRPASLGGLRSRIAARRAGEVPPGGECAGELPGACGLRGGVLVRSGESAGRRAGWSGGDGRGEYGALAGGQAAVDVGGEPRGCLGAG